MPRTKKPAGSVPPSTPTTNGSAVQSDVLTLAEAAVYLRLSEANVVRLVEEQALPARQLGKEWRFLKAAIQHWLSTPPPRGNKEAWMALAGVWKDDPDVEEELKETYTQRGRPITEDET